MKVAVLSDIHGNFQALESVMEDVKANNCEQVFALEIWQWRDRSRGWLLIM